MFDTIKLWRDFVAYHCNKAKNMFWEKNKNKKKKGKKQEQEHEKNKNKEKKNKNMPMFSCFFLLFAKNMFCVPSLAFMLYEQ